MSQMPMLPAPPSLAQERLTITQLIPFGSKKIRMWRSRALVPLLVTGLTCVVLFTLLRHVDRPIDALASMQVFAAFMTFAMFSALYFYLGEKKNMLWYAVPVAITAGQLFYLLNPYIYVFRTLLPGNVASPGTDFLSAFLAHFFGAGMMEELLKAVPALFGLVVALLVRRSGTGGGLIGRGLRLRGPVDGILVGFAAGAAFILFETLLQYVPNTITKVHEITKGDVGFSVLVGFLLLVPRVLNGVVGHMAWAGISGYFIGLAVLYPRDAWKLLPAAWIVPAALHGFWNATWVAPILGVTGLYISAGLTLFLFIACALRAKHIEVSRLGEMVGGSSILLSPNQGEPGVVHASRQDGQMAQQAGVAVAGIPAIPEARLCIGTRRARYALTSGMPIDFGALFGTEGAPAGASGYITGQFDGAFEIRNAGIQTWAVTSPGVGTVLAPAGSSVRVAAGSRLVIGGAVMDVQTF